MKKHVKKKYNNRNRKNAINRNRKNAINNEEARSFEIKKMKKHVKNKVSTKKIIRKANYSNTP